MKITRAWLGDQFDAGVLERGENCWRNSQVCEVEVIDQGRAVSGIVQGDGRYSVYIEMDEFGLDGDCSCPTGYHCEHVAALLFAYISAPDERPAAPDGISADAKATGAETAAPVETAEALQQTLLRHDYPPDVTQRILYLLRPEANDFHVRVHVVTARLLKDGGFGAPTPFYLNNLGKHLLHRFVMPVDAHILQCIPASACGKASFSPIGPNAAEMMMLLLSTDRCYWLDSNRPALTLGDTRAGTWRWHTSPDAHQHLRLSVGQDNNTLVLPCSPPLYVDPDVGTCGIIHSACPDDAYESLLFMPPIEPGQSWPQEGMPSNWPAGVAGPQALNIQRQHHAPVAILQLMPEDVSSVAGSGTEQTAAGIRLMFDYGGRLLPQQHGVAQVYYQTGDQWLVTATDADAELAYIRLLDDAGLIPNPALPSPFTSSASHTAQIPHWLLPGDAQAKSASPVEPDWPGFITATLPGLQQAGFRVETMPGFRYDIVQVRQWDVRCTEHGIMGEVHFEVVLDDGLHIDLIEIVANWINADPERLSETALKQMLALEVHYLPLPDGRMLPIASDMLHGMLVALLDLFSMTSEHSNDYNTTAMQWMALRKVLTAAKKDTPYIHIQDDAVWHDRMRQLATMHEIPELEPPAGLSVSLRDYQQHGLNWLQHLRRLNLGALLADDMGLGKTIQTLAHILKEKEAGLLSKPVLVVAPTSLMHNWKAEAARFAPGLKVFVLHGAARKEHFSSLGQYDLALTTYALLHRDSSALQRQRWSMLILDEAQHIRNPRTGAACAARALEADQRICLTGTPMENHLGELWALFDFLMPGYLSDLRTFKRCFRTPIESEADSQRQARLNLRIRPFMLRRSKEAVAAELPAKTNIIRTIDMGTAQRELYEGVRLLMHQQVREAMQRMGKGESNIIMLNALLKMRQICCDPRLLKPALLKQALPAADIATETTASAHITLESIDRAGSAKLELLRDMLPEMIAEGRRILLFSQFTAMLKLIAALCDECSIPYVSLTGASRDRATPVTAFQRRAVPLFLISLKAGGVGLNLTAADTVIHYDPWWNPAAEAQASDRAHRIGQDKPVFVYKLITGGSVESRVLDMQMRKQSLADALYQGSKQSTSLWSNAELESLFAPLEE